MVTKYSGYIHTPATRATGYVEDPNGSVVLAREYAALEAELARVKAESLRVVADGGPMKNYSVVRHKVVLYEGELWRASNIPYELINICTGETIDPPENATVQPVRRLERWEATE